MEYCFTHKDITFFISPYKNEYRVTLKSGAEFVMKKTPSVVYHKGGEVDFPAPSSVDIFHSGTSDTVKIVYALTDKITALCHAGIDRTTGDILFTVNVTGDEAGDIKLLKYPAPFEFGAEKGHGYTVLSRMQGTVIPAGEPIIIETGLVYQRDAYMPIFAQMRDGAGYTAIFDTPYDAKYLPDGDRIAPAWRTSLKTMRYTRKIRYIFRDDFDYNVAAKCYREYLIERGRLITLKEKAVKNQNRRKQG